MIINQIRHSFLCYKKHFARKRFGQNFLKDQFIIKSIISAIDPQKGQALVEIGPGLAALTKPVTEILDHLTVIELDRDLVLRLQNQPFLKSKLTIYQQDVMTINFNELSEKLGKPLRIFGNLPYNISTKLIFYMLKYINVVSDMHFMMQKEVIDRIIAGPNSKKYGLLSIMVQLYYQVTPLLEVLPKFFTPLSKVNSVMAKFVPHTRISNPVKDINILNFVAKKAFSQRRKTIRNSLRDIFTSYELNILGIDPTVRAENISVAKYAQIANFISENNIL